MQLKLVCLSERPCVFASVHLCILTENKYIFHSGNFLYFDWWDSVFSWEYISSLPLVPLSLSFDMDPGLNHWLIIIRGLIGITLIHDTDVI